MNDEARDNIHELQDRIIAAAEARGYGDEQFVIYQITVGDLRTMIFPDYEAELRRIWIWLKGPDAGK